MLQVLITVWLGVHPVTYTLPTKYSSATDQCQQYVNWLFAHRTPKGYRKMRIECVKATGRDA